MQNKTDVRPINALAVILMSGSAACGAEWCSDALSEIGSTGGSVIAVLMGIFPYIITAVTAVLAGNTVNRKVRLRTMLLVGIALHCIGGTLPAFLSGSAVAVLVCRAVFGAGYGITLALSFTLVYKLYIEERKRNSALGLSAAAHFTVVLIGIMISHAAGEVKTSCAFFICLWDIIPFIAVIVLCPDFELYTAPKPEGSGLSKLEQLASNDALDYSAKALPSVVWVFSFTAALFVFGISSVYSSADILCGGQNAELPVIISLASGIFGGILYGTFEKILKAASLTVCLILSAAACLVIYFVNTSALLCVAFGAFGFFCVGVIPAMFSRIFTLVDNNGIFLAGGIIACGSAIGILLGNALSPFISTYIPVIAAILFAVSVLLTVSYSKKAY